MRPMLTKPPDPDDGVQEAGLNDDDWMWIDDDGAGYAQKVCGIQRVNVDNGSGICIDNDLDSDPTNGLLY